MLPNTNTIQQNTKENNAYYILNCTMDHDLEQIKKEYYILSKQYHPDKNSANEEYYKKINQAYQILKNETTRKEYDKWLNSGINITFEKFRDMEEHLKVFHWTKDNGNKKIEMKKEVMNSDELINKFRNYQI